MLCDILVLLEVIDRVVGSQVIEWLRLESARVHHRLLLMQRDRIYFVRVRPCWRIKGRHASPKIVGLGLDKVHWL